MDDNFIKLVEEVNNYTIDRIIDKIRTKIIKKIENLRKDDDEFSKKLERLEYDLWVQLTGNHDSNLRDLVKIYDSLKSLKFGIDSFTNSVNTN